MNRRVWVLGAFLLGLLGCAHSQTRSQAPDEEHDPDADVLTIGKMSSFGNATPIPVSGVGLVVGLDGTGDSPPGDFRKLLEDQLRKRGVEHVKELLASKDTALVLVSALIPPGTHKGDVLDVDVGLPPQSKCSSLRGGYLKESLLFNYDSTRNLDPNSQGANRTLLGHRLVKAEGMVQTGGGGGEPAGPAVHGRVWGGGKSLIDRGFYVVMEQNHQSAAKVQRVAQRINETFHGPFQGALHDVAVARTKVYLTLDVPPQYRLNLPRYLRVVRLIPLEGVPPAQGPYRRHLEKELLDSAHTVTAALRLEALGNDSIPVLRRGLESEHALVRFASAEALAYLGCPACGEELARLTLSQPALRAYCLTALASLEEPVSHVKLRELLAAPAAETRYGAFRALRALDKHDPAVQGELLNETFWLHRAAAGSTPLVHLSGSRRAEIVLFGGDAALVPPFSFLAGEFTVTAARGDQRCTLSRLSIQHGAQRRQCSLQVETVIRNLADMGGMYPEVVDVLRQAGTYHCLNCPVGVDALPQAASVFDLAKYGDKHPDLLEAGDEVLKSRDDFGATPTLFDKGSGRDSPPDREASAEPIRGDGKPEGTPASGHRAKAAG
jgi:flagellar P-ring protein FlgI